jgi:tetratricopeptide (TPR) repeat protein
VTDTGDAPSADRLERALELFLEHTERGAGDPASLLAAHPDLRELLDPLFGAGATPAAADQAADTGLGDFRLVRELGRGGMGIVYEAWQRSLDRRVALKMLSPALVASPSAVARFRREAAAVARLRHPGIVEVHGFGSAGDKHWFAMGLVVGTPLTECAARFRTPAAAAALAIQVLDALAHAHSHGILHRDVKPGNVLVRDDGTAVLTDFGIAHDDTLPSMTREGSFVGTLEYASPEQLRGQTIGAATDIWAVGVLLHELLTGALPFARSSATATMRAILVEEPASPAQRRQRLPRDLLAIVARALEKEPARRYASAGEFLADLRAWQAGGVVSARTPGLGERVLRWLRREPWRATAAVVLLLALPVVAASLAYVTANAPRIAAAAAAEQRRLREDVLTNAWLSLAEDEATAGLRALDAAALPADDLEAAVARAALQNRAGGHDAATAALRPFAGQRTADLVLAMLQDQIGGAFDFRSAAGATAIESFVLGLFAYESAQEHRSDRALHAEATRHLGAAVAMAAEPRAAFLFWWMIAASRARDAAAFDAAYRAYELHFPDSRGLRLAVALSASAVPPERGLAVLGAVDLAAAPRFHLALALLLDRAGRSEESVAAYRRGLTADPSNSRAWSQLASVLQDLGRTEEAVAAARKACEATPQDGVLWSQLGGLLLLSGDRTGGREALERAIELTPGEWRPRNNLTMLLLEIGDVDAALAMARTAVELAPMQPEPHAALAQTLRKLGNKQEALLEDLRVLQLDDRDWQRWSVVALRLAEQGWSGAARTHAERATTLAPTQPLAWSRRAEVLLAPPDADATDALAAARRADELAAGGEPRVTWILARAEAATGAVDAAIQRLEALLAAHANLPAGLRRLVTDELERLRRPN